MASRWQCFHNRQLQDPEVKKLYEAEMAELNQGIRAARFRRRLAWLGATLIGGLILGALLF